MIQLEHISKSFAGKSGAVDALKDVTIRVEKGDIYGMMGCILQNRDIETFIEKFQRS